VDYTRDEAEDREEEVTLIAVYFGGAGNDTLRGGRGTDTIYGGSGKNLINCAYLETRADDVADTAYYNPNQDTVVDCKTKNPWDPTDPASPPAPSTTG
jgi:hypothetical protein